ncbi:MAG TPA: Wzz/FepE/Etk N-terminal domain-containing protein [Cyclobacteriaceae bacterium]|nr:Wzz/FepE/Etk N-terminal domain-containing protein [Cyclobacteriaceae bacterium]HNU40974.1 Wzz/FepE/Etk N-terminal domain-containing protein [Cyclobacteriaceae bacterium]
MDVIYLLKVLWRKKLWLVLIPILSGVAAYFFTLTLVDQYKSTTQIATGFTTNEAIRVSDERPSIRDTDLSFNNLLTSMNSGISSNLTSYSLILHDLDSASAAFRTPDKDEKLELNPEEIKIVDEIFKRKLENLELLTLDDEHASLLLKALDWYGYNYQFIKDGLKIFRVPNTDFIQIEFTSENPSLSAYAANAFCNEFLRYYRGQRVEGSSISVSFFKQLVEQKKKEMDERTETLKTFKATNSFVNINEEGSSKLLQISELELEQDNVESKIYGLNLSLDRFNNELSSLGNKEAGTSGSISSARVLTLREKINKLNERYITTGSSNTVLLDSLNLLRNQLKNELAKLSTEGVQPSGLTKTELTSKINDLKIEIAIEQSKLNSITAKLRNLRGSISGYASKESIVASLQGEVDVATKEYLDAVSRYNEANNKLLASTGTFRQLYKATAPANPVSNKKILILAGAVFASFFFCVFVFVGLEVIDTTLRTPEHFKRTVKIELAEQLIKVDTQSLNFLTLFDTKTNSTELEVFKEFVRKLRYQIEMTGSRIFLITSCKKGEGKTFITFTLAHVLSLVNKRVLIVDTNFKNNGLTRWLSTKKGDVRLLERKKDHEVKLLSGNEYAKRAASESAEESSEESIYNLVTATRFKNIFIIGNNGGFESPDEILSGKNFSQLIEILSMEYDYIFLEGASLNDYSDSKELEKYVQKVIPVFSADTSIGQLDRESINYLKSLGKKLSGAILNKVELKNLKI